jgi:hypothetical protein
MGRTPAESRVHGDNTVNTAPKVYSPEGDEADTCMGGAVSGVLVGSSHSSRSMAVFSARPAQLHFHLRYFMQDKAGRICVVPALIPREKHLRDRFAADAAFPSRF